MKIKCINAKNYALTNDKEYEVLHDEGEKVVIINDNNKVQRYYKTLFENIIEEEPVVELPQRTEQDLIDSLTVKIDEDLLCAVKYTDLQNNNQVLILNLNGFDRSDVSCGILEYEGLNGIFNWIDASINTEEDDLLEFRKELLKQIISNIVNYKSCAFVLFSTNYQNEYDDYYFVLDDISYQVTDWVNNPNSGNNIKLWTVKHN